MAQPALQEGKYVGKVIKARLAGAPAPPPFKYFDKGSMATIGYRSAVADAFKVKVTGVLAYLMWAFIHVAVPGRLGQPARHDVHVGAGARVHARTAGHRIITFEQAHSQVEHHAAAAEGHPGDRAVGPAGDRHGRVGSAAAR